MEFPISRTMSINNERSSYREIRQSRHTQNASHGKNGSINLSAFDGNVGKLVRFVNNADPQYRFG